MRYQQMSRAVRKARPAAMALVFTLVTGLMFASYGASDNEAISRPVLGFQQTLIAVMKEGAELGFAGRKVRMQSLVNEHFNMSAITRAVIGRHYAQMAAGERESLGTRINEFAIATLASRFSRFDNERFLEPTVRAVLDDRARLTGKFVAADGDTTDLTYDLHRQDRRWRIVNISFGGVSGTDIQRAEFETFLRDGGAALLRDKLDALIVDIERKAN